MTGKISQSLRILNHVRATGETHPEAIRDALGLTCSAASVAVTLSRHRADGLLPKAKMSPHAIFLPEEVQAQLSIEARARDCSVSALASALLRVTLRDDMVDAILDGVKP